MSFHNAWAWHFVCNLLQISYKIGCIYAIDKKLLNQWTLMGLFKICHPKRAEAQKTKHFYRNNNYYNKWLFVTPDEEEELKQRQLDELRKKEKHENFTRIESKKRSILIPIVGLCFAAIPVILTIIIMSGIFPPSVNGPLGLLCFGSICPAYIISFVCIILGTGFSLKSRSLSNILSKPK